MFFKQKQQHFEPIMNHGINHVFKAEVCCWNSSFLNGMAMKLIRIDLN